MSYNKLLLFSIFLIKQKKFVFNKILLKDLFRNLFHKKEKKKLQKTETSQNKGKQKKKKKNKLCQ